MTVVDIVLTFNSLFATRYNTKLCGGAPEPLYKSASYENEPHEIRFRSNYASSALHEVAHWCIAGESRRLLDDYGYWYVENRAARQQKEFELLESKPQALEWILSVAADIEFRVSCDNFNEVALNLDNFREQIAREARYYVNNGLPARAALFADALASLSGVLNYAEIYQFEGRPK